MAHAEPIVEVAGGAQGHGVERGALSLVLRCEMRVGEATPGRALIAPPSGGESTFGAGKGPGVRKREVLRNEPVASDWVVDPVPPRHMLFPGFEHCRRAAWCARAVGALTEGNRGFCVESQSSICGDIRPSGRGQRSQGWRHPLRTKALYAMREPGERRRLCRKTHWNLPAALRTSATCRRENWNLPGLGRRAGTRRTGTFQPTCAQPPCPFRHSGRALRPHSAVASEGRAVCTPS